MKRPRQSPDMNPIENLWKLLKKRIIESRPKDPSEMKLFAKEKWASIPNETRQAYVAKFIKRLLTLFDNKKGPNKFQIHNCEMSKYFFHHLFL